MENCNWSDQNIKAIQTSGAPKSSEHHKMIKAKREENHNHIEI